MENPINSKKLTISTISTIGLLFIIPIVITFLCITFLPYKPTTPNMIVPKNHSIILIHAGDIKLFVKQNTKKILSILTIDKLHVLSHKWPENNNLRDFPLEAFQTFEDNPIDDICIITLETPQENDKDEKNKKIDQNPEF